MTGCDEGSVVGETEGLLVGSVVGFDVGSVVGDEDGNSNNHDILTELDGTILYEINVN